MVELMRTAIPNNEYYEYYGPDYELDVRPSNMTDHNTREYLAKLKEAVFEVLRDQNAAPSVPLQGALVSPENVSRSQRLTSRQKYRR